MIDDLTRYTEAVMGWLEKSGQVTVSIAENGDKLFASAPQGAQWIWPPGEAADHTPEYLEVMAALVRGDVVHEEVVDGKKVYTVKDKEGRPVDPVHNMVKNKRPADPGRADPKTIQELKKENLELRTEMARLEVVIEGVRNLALKVEKEAVERHAEWKRQKREWEVEDAEDESAKARYEKQVAQVDAAIQEEVRDAEKLKALLKEARPRVDPSWRPVNPDMDDPLLKLMYP
jgi:hypothetical protein